MKSRLYKLKIFSLLLFVFSLPFEYWDPFGVSSIFTVTKFAGFIYFGFSLLDIRNNFQVKFFKRPLFLLLSIWFLLFFINVYNYIPTSTLSPYNLTFLQNIILFWLIGNDLRQNENLLRKIFVTIVSSVFIMGVFVGIGVGLGSGADKDLGDSRLTFFGSNSNTVGNLAGISIFLIIAMLLDRKNFFGLKTWLLSTAIPSLLFLLSISGSRGALIICFAGVLLLFLLQKGSPMKKTFSIVLGVIFLFLSFEQILKSDIIRKRVIATAQQGSLGGRDLIWNHALSIFYDYPLFGVGNLGYEQEMRLRLGHYIDTHNLFLYFMVTSGTVGLSLFLIFIYSLFEKAKVYYRIRNGLLFGILLMFIIAIFKSGGAINIKLYWLLAAIIYGQALTTDTLKKIKFSDYEKNI